MLCDGVLNMHEIKYGMETNEVILGTYMQRGFKGMFILYEAT